MSKEEKSQIRIRWIEFLELVFEELLKNYMKLYQGRAQLLYYIYYTILYDTPPNINIVQTFNNDTRNQQLFTRTNIYI